jgi:hypothetical protein
MTLYLYKQKQNTMKQATLITLALYSVIVLVNLIAWDII